MTTNGPNVLASDQSTRNDSIPLIYEIVKDAINLQQEQKKSLESKASLLITFSGVIFALLMGAIDTLSKLFFWSKWLIVISLFLFTLAVILSIIVILIHPYRLDPNPDVLARTYLLISEEQTKKQLISNMVGSWNKNKPYLHRNAIMLGIAFFVELTGFLLLGIAFLITFKG